MPNNIYLKLNWKCTLYSCKSMDKLVKNAVHECIPKIGGSDFQFPRSKNHIMRMSNITFLKYLLVGIMHIKNLQLQF